MGGKLHLNLEGIALEANLIELYRLEHLPTITYKASRCIANIYAQYRTHINGCAIRHQHASHRPIHHIHARDITASYCYVCTLIGASIIQLEQILRIMREVSIHLKYIIIFVLNSPFKASDICRSETELASAFD